MLFCVFLSTQSFGIFLERGFESILSIGLSPKLWILDDRTKISTWDAITPFAHLLVCHFYYQTIQKPRNHQAKTDIQNKSSSSDRTRRKEKATKILSVRVRIDHWPEMENPDAQDIWMKSITSSIKYVKS